MTISIEEGLDLIYNKTKVVSSELLPIEMVLGRVLSEDLTASFNLPRFDNSAMDGYAVKVSDGGNRTVCDNIIYAGDNPNLSVKSGHVLKIMTGAPIPNGCEAVVPIEDTAIEDGLVKLPTNILKNNNIRRSGEDIKEGFTYLHRGEKLSAYSIALLSSQGVTHVTVNNKIKVAVFATGDELRPHYEKIEKHQLYNSNTPMLISRLESLGCEVSYIKSSEDTMEALEQSIKSSLWADMILTSGGVSMGDKDFTKDAFKNLGMVSHFEKINIKPGKPVSFGTLERRVIINLPGNPLAAMVNFELFARASIRKMSGANDYYHNPTKAKIRDALQIKAGKFTVKLGVFDGEYFTPIKKQLPGMISPMQSSNAMMITTPKIDKLTKDSYVDILPISWEFTSCEKVDFFV